MAFKDWSLSFKVAVVALVAAVLPMVAGTAISWAANEQAMSESVTQQLTAHAERVADELDAFNVSFVDVATMLASVTSIQLTVTPDAPESEIKRAREVLSSVTQRDTRVSSVQVVDRTGLVRLSTNRALEGTTVKDRIDFAAAASGRSSISSLFVPGSSRENDGVISYTAPLGDGSFVAVLVRAEAFWNIAQRLNGRVWDGSYVVVLDDSGVRIAHGARPDLLFRPAGLLTPKDRAQFTRFKRFGDDTESYLEPVAEKQEWRAAVSPSAGMTEMMTYAPNGAGQGERMAIARRMKSSPWTVVSVASTDAIKTPLTALVTRLLWRTGLVVLLGFILAFMLATRMVAPVQPLVQAARDLSRGLAPQPVTVDRTDELGELTTQFNAMMKATLSHRNELEGKVEERTRSLTAANQELKVQQEELRAQQDELEKKNQEVEKATQLKSAFLANMSHELPTPLNSVIGFSELLSEEAGDALSERHRRYLRDVRGAGKHLLSLINDILDISKIEAGRLDLRRETIPAAELLNNAQSLVGGTALSRQILITQDVRSQRSVSADPEKLRQALVNLLSNAVKFSPPKSEVVLSVEDIGAKIRFSVRDQGPGIEPELMPRLFEPFVQGENPMVKKHQGTGLGLAIARRLVESHGGKLQVASARGQGATFFFELEAHLGEQRRLTPSQLAAVNNRTTVLLLESRTERADALRSALRTGGFEVGAPQSGESAATAARRLAPKVVVFTPGADDDSLDTLRSIRNDPALRDLPIVLTTTPHASGVLGKPLEPGEVVNAVRRATSGRTPARVLVVDDDRRALELVRAALTPQGYDVETCESGAAALVAARARKPDVLLTDLMMPEMSGFELVETLAADPELRSVPVLVLTALDLDAAQREMLRERTFATARKGDVTAMEIVTTVERLTRRNVVAGSDARTVLVVDDHDLNRELARARLERRGFRVIEADGGEAGVRIAQEARPSLVLMDLSMPGMDGFAAFKAIRSGDETRRIPVVALTAMAMRRDEEAVHAAGFDGYLTKPLEVSRLDAELARLIPA
ncbi:MAG: response regulator [Archangium sp.]